MTLTEIIQILMNNYTSEELVELLDLSPENICLAFEDEIMDQLDDICERIKEDLGYDDEEDY
jgi:hypothetical protein